MQLRLKVLVEVCVERFSSVFEKGKMFDAFNKSLPNALLDACRFYGDYYGFIVFKRFLKNMKMNPEMKNEHYFLTLNFIIFSIKSIKNKANYISDFATLEMFKNLDQICFNTYPKLLDDLIVFFDSFILGDDIINSTIGVRTGEVYKEIVAKINEDADNFDKKDIWSDVHKLKASLNIAEKTL